MIRPPPRLMRQFVITVACCAGLALVSACTAETSRGRPSASSATSPKPTYDGSAYAASILKAVTDSFLLTSTADACAVGLGWVCAIDRIESPSERAIKVTLKPEQVWISMADTTDWFKWGEVVARNIYHFVDATGTWTGACWRQTTDPPDEINVYKPNGEVAFLSPLGFPSKRQRHPNPC
jgi:hypothetical protein